MFYLPIYVNDEKGTSTLVSTEQLEKNIEFILSITKDIELKENPSVFTTLNRSDWYKVSFV